MEDAFEIAVEEVLGLEGGYVNNPADPGGETNWGISKKAFPNVDIKNLSRNAAKDLYKAHYWDPIASYHLQGKFATIAFSCAVNQGVDKCKRLLEASKGQIDWFQAERALAYIALPTFQGFGRGWLRRLFKEML